MVPYDRPIRLLPVLDTSAVIEVCTLGRFQRSNTSTETQHDRLVQYWRQTPHSIQIALLSMCTKSYMRAVSIHCIRLMERGPKRRENAQEATMVPSAGRTSHTEILAWTHWYDQYQGVCQHSGADVVGSGWSRYTMPRRRAQEYLLLE
jgi:hypothetical protein